MTVLPAPGSMAAHDALVLAYTAWRGAEGDFDTAQTTDRAVCADRAWLIMMAHAINCGWSMAGEDMLPWVRRRVASYARLMGQDVLGVFLTGEALTEPFAA